MDDRGLLIRPWRRKILAIRVSPSQLDRALDIFATVLSCIASVRGKLEVSRKSKDHAFETWIEVNGERFGVELVERLRVTERQRTKTESRLRSLWSNDPVKAFTPTGRLMLKLVGLEGMGTRQRWEDTPSCPLEQKLSGFSTGLLVAAEALRTKREKHERQRRELNERRRRAEAAHQERLRQDALVLQVLQMQRQWRAARELRAFLDEVEHVVPEEMRDEALDEALALIRLHIEQIDPLTSAEKALEMLTQPDEKEWTQEIGLGVVRPVRAPSYR